MALAENRRSNRLMAPPNHDYGRTPMRRQSDEDAAKQFRATAWSAVGLAAAAVAGLVEVPGMRLIWIVMLVFAVAAVPQSLLAARLHEKRRKDR